MNEYVIFTDSGCDISKDILNDWDVRYECLTFKFEDSDTVYSNDDMSIEEFYDNMRQGRVAKTSGINVSAFKEVFEKELEKGNDIIYLAISSGLSVTYNSACIAADELRDKYPDRKIIISDTLCASAGLGLILYMAVEKKKEGASIEELAKFVEDNRLSICHWVTVDDLVYLKRGGRISPLVALSGGILGIKPVIHVNDEGQLLNVSKSRGRKAALKAIVDKYGELAVDPANGTVFISHGDCIDDVKQLESMLKAEYGATVKIIADIGPVIGAHAGPGTIALFYVGKQR